MSAAEDFLEPKFESPAPSGSSECVAFVGDNQTHDTVLRALQQYYPEPLVRDGGTSAALEYISDGHQPRVLIIDVGESDDPLSSMLSLSTALPEEVRVIGIGTVNDITLYRELTEVGVLDYLVKPVTERQLSAALAKLDSEQTETKDTPGESQRIAVIGARGGAGATSVAVNLGWIMAEERKQKTMLIDLDLWFGTMALALDLEPTRGLREALENPARIDGLFISSSTAKLTENLSVMAAEEALAGEMLYYAGATEILIEALGHSNNCLVMDLPRGAFRMRHPVLEASTLIALVTPLSLAGLRDSIRLLGSIDDSGSSAKVRIVANRAGGPCENMSAEEFQKALGRKIDFVIPEDPKAFKEAVNNGKAVAATAPRSKAARVLRALAAEAPTAAAAAAAGKAGGKSILSRFLPRK